MRLRREQMQKHWNAGTYAAMEREIVDRAEQAQRAKPVVAPPDLEPEPIDERDPIEIARAAAAALKGKEK